MSNNSTFSNNSIKGLFQGMIPDGDEVVQGRVVSVNPLCIQVVNDSKLMLNASLLIVPRHLSDYSANVDIMQGGGVLSASTETDGSHMHSYSGNTDISSHSHEINGIIEDDSEDKTEFSGNTEKVSHSHSYSGTTEEQPHMHHLSTFNIRGATITVYNALKIGEMVHLLSFNKGKKYYILDRVV